MIRRNTWLALGILALVATLALLISRPRGNEVEALTPTPKPFWSVESSEIVGLTIEDTRAASTIELERHPEDLWRSVRPEGGAVDAARVERSVGWLASPSPRAQIMQVNDLSEFALDPPQYVIEVRLASGERLIFSVGRESPTGGSRYVLAPGIEEVFIVSNLGLDEVLTLPSELGAVEPTQVVSPAD